MITTQSTVYRFEGETNHQEWEIDFWFDGEWWWYNCRSLTHGDGTRGGSKFLYEAIERAEMWMGLENEIIVLDGRPVARNT